MNLDEIILEREMKFKCLGCGKDLSDKIINRKIRIHLCDNCRREYLRKFRIRSSKRSES